MPVGSVTDIVLTQGLQGAGHDPRRLLARRRCTKGTVAQVRVPSLSSVANRYIALTPGPQQQPGAVRTARRCRRARPKKSSTSTSSSTRSTRRRARACRASSRATPNSTLGAGRQLGESTEYFAPSLSAIDHFFSELVRDQPTFTHFLVETAKAVTTIGARQQQLTDLIENANTTFQAIGSQQTQLAAGPAPAADRRCARATTRSPNCLATFAALKQFDRHLASRRPSRSPHCSRTCARC